MVAKKMKSQREMKKVAKKESRSVSFAELRDDLFREAAKLVSEDPSSRIAILITPPPSESDVSIQSFGYPSAQGVVQTFLEDTRPVPVPEDAGEGEGDDDDDEEDDDDDEDPLPQRLWWEDAELLDSKNPEELMAAIDEMSRLRNHIRMVKNPKQLKAAMDESSSRVQNRIRLGARERGQVSGKHEEHLNDDKAGPKP